MNIKSQFLDQPKFKDKHEYAILFYFIFIAKKRDKVCVNVSPYPQTQIAHCPQCVYNMEKSYPGDG